MKYEIKDGYVSEGREGRYEKKATKNIMISKDLKVKLEERSESTKIVAS